MNHILAYLISSLCNLRWYEIMLYGICMGPEVYLGQLSLCRLEPRYKACSEYSIIVVFSWKFIYFCSVKKSLTRILSLFVILAFVNFMFSNVVFMHIHKDSDGHLITHSHPYLPSGSHTHTGSSLDLVAAFNAASQAAKFTNVISLSAPVVMHTLVRSVRDLDVVIRHTSCYSLRAPPVLSV